MLKRLLTALAVLALLTGFMAACGGDDDDDDVATDDTDQSTDEDVADDAADDPMAVVCSDTGQADDGVITAEEAGVGAAQFEAVSDPPAEIADDITGSAEYLRMLEEQGEDQAVEDVLLSEHLTAVGEWCEANMAGTDG